jgi:uncharacterized protein (DUF1501 family)
MKRRSFISKSALGIFAPYVTNTISGTNSISNMLNNALQTADLANDHVLVLIQLTGGNDGLNTVLPLETFGNLWAARNSIIVPDTHFIKPKLSDKIAFHPALEGIRDMFDENKIRIVNGVGYPNPDFSHFKSTDIWMSGSDSNQSLPTGWLGRYLAQEYVNYPFDYPNSKFPDPPAIVTNSVIPLIFQGLSSSLGAAVADPTLNYQLYGNKFPFIANGKAASELEFLRQTSSLTNKYTTKIQESALKVTRQKEYPNTRLGYQLKNIARLIASGVKSKVYYANLPGFDTHANQVDRQEPWKGVHANLLTELSEAIVAFQADMKFLGISKRVIGTTFSEFGRRVGSNASFGSDHGAAAPMIIFGEQALGGLAGENPMIEQYANPNTNVPMQYDFRSVFSSILKDWFCVNQNVLENTFLANYQYIPLVANFDCLGVTGNEENKYTANDIYRPENPNSPTKITAIEKTLSDSNRLKVYPNPFNKAIKIEFESAGGNCQLQLFNSMGQLISMIDNSDFPKGFYKANFDGEYLPDAMYHIRFQNQSFQKVLNVLKASK